MGGGGGGVDLFTLMLLLRVLNSHLPPVTLATSLLPVLITLRVIPLFARDSFLSTVTTCSSAVETLLAAGFSSSGDGNNNSDSLLGSLMYIPSMLSLVAVHLPLAIARCVKATLFYTSSMHLYLILGSWMYKARREEQRIGSATFAVFTILAIVGTCVLTQGLGMLLVLCTSPDQFGGWMVENWLSPAACASGMGGVTFALKAVMTFRRRQWQRQRHHPAQEEEEDVQDALHGTLRGLVGDTRAELLLWLELVWVQLVAPESSGLQHVAGILFGYLYVRWKGEEKVVRRLGRALEQLMRV